MARSDLAFTFNPKQVLDGIGKINDNMGKMVGNVKSQTKALSGAVAKGMLKATAMIGAAVAAFKGMRNVVQKHIPEIGKTFNVVSDIFFKNFLWPIRKQLAPILQKILNWARENRATFVKWGQAVANVFRTIVIVAKNVIEWGREIFNQINRIFTGLFGDQVKSWEEAWNLLTAKIAIGAVFLGEIVKNIITWFADIAEKNGPALLEIIGQIVGTAMKLITMFGPSIKELFEDVIGFVLTLVNKHWPAFENALISTGMLLEKYIRKWGPALAAWFDDAVGFLLEMFNTKIIPIADQFLGIIDDLVFQSGLFEAAWNGVKLIISTALTSIQKFLTGFSKYSRDIGENLTGIVENISGIVKDLTTVTEKGNSIYTVMESIGELFGTVLETVTGIVESLTGGFRREIKGIQDTLQNIVDNVKGFVDDLNTATAEGNTIRTIFETVGEIFGKIVNTVTKIVEGITGGFRQGIEGIQDPIQGIVDAFSNIWDLLFGKGEGVGNFFKNVGRYLGEGLRQSLSVVEWILEKIVEIVDYIKNFFENTWPDIKSKFGLGEGGIFAKSGAIGQLLSGKSGLAGMANEAINRASQFTGSNSALGPTYTLDDGLVTDKGDVVKFNPNDNILAFQDKLPGGDTIEVNMGGVYVSVTEGNAYNAGQNFANGLQEELRQLIESERRSFAR